MTLQRFIMAYIFQPLSLPLSRLVAARRLPAWPAFLIAVAAPSLVTFIAIGIWHGAGWTFALFGAMHGVYICVNQAWRERRTHRRRTLRRLGRAAPEPGGRA